MLCFLLSGCLSKHSETLPISDEKLEAILIDVHVAESAMSTLQNGVKKDSLTVNNNTQINSEQEKVVINFIGK